MKKGAKKMNLLLKKKDCKAMVLLETPLLIEVLKKHDNKQIKRIQVQVLKKKIKKLSRRVNQFLQIHKWKLNN